MNIRALLLISSMSFSAFQLHAIPSLQDIDLLAGRLITNTAGFIDSIGAYFELCRPPIHRAVSHTATAVGEHLSNLNVGAAVDAAKYAANQMSNEELPYAPVTTFVGNHMREMKGAVMVIGGFIGGVALYKVVKFITKKRKSSKNDSN